MVDEVIDDLLLFSVGDPENMPGLHIDDVSGVLPAVVELGFINSEELCGLFRLDQFLSAYGVQLLQPLLVNCFYSVLSQAGNLRYLFVGVRPNRQQISCVLVQLLCHAVSSGFKGYELAPGCSAGRALELVVRKEDAA